MWVSPIPDLSPQDAKSTPLLPVVATINVLTLPNVPGVVTGKVIPVEKLLHHKGLNQDFRK